MNLSELTESVVIRLQDTDHRLMAYEDYEDHVLAGVLEYSRFLPRYKKDVLTLVAGQADYPAPADFDSYLMSEWGKYSPGRKPWDRSHRLAGVPSVFFVDGQIHLDPPPSAIQVATFTAQFNYVYRVAHIVDATSSTIPASHLLLVRLAALASACKQIAAASDQSEAFVKRYYSLAKRYGERFTELIGKPKAAIVRS